MDHIWEYSYKIIQHKNGHLEDRVTRISSQHNSKANQKVQDNFQQDITNQSVLWNLNKKHSKLLAERCPKTALFFSLGSFWLNLGPKGTAE